MANRNRVGKHVRRTLGRIVAPSIVLVLLAFLGVPACADTSADTAGGRAPEAPATSTRTIIVGSEAGGSYVALEDGKLVGFGGGASSDAPGDLVDWVTCDYRGQPSVAEINGAHNTWAWSGGSWTELSTGGDQLVGSKTYIRGANFVLRLGGDKIVGWNGATFIYPTSTGAVSDWVATDYEGHPSVAIIDDQHTTWAWTGASWTELSTGGDQLIGSKTYIPGANFVLRLDGTKIMGFDGTTGQSPTPTGDVLAWVACDYKGHPSVAVINDVHDTLAWAGWGWTGLSTGVDEVFGSQVYIPGANFVLRLDMNKIVAWDGTKFVYPTPTGNVSSWAGCEVRGHRTGSVTVPGGKTLAWDGMAWTEDEMCAPAPQKPHDA